MSLAKGDDGKIVCDACPVLCRIRDGKTGACDRYANVAGALTRLDPLVVIQGADRLVPFAADVELYEPGGDEIVGTSRMRIDTPEKPHSILPLIFYRNWVKAKALDVRGADHLRGPHRERDRP